MNQGTVSLSGNVFVCGSNSLLYLNFTFAVLSFIHLISPPHSCPSVCPQHSPFLSLLIHLSHSFALLIFLPFVLVRETKENCRLVVPPQYLIRIKHIRTMLCSIIHNKLGDTRTVFEHPPLTEEEGEKEKAYLF